MDIKKRGSLELTLCNPSLWKPRDPKLIYKDIINT